jgi:hypothetical protein
MFINCKQLSIVYLMINIFLDFEQFNSFDIQYNVLNKDSSRTLQIQYKEIQRWFYNYNLHYCKLITISLIYN